MNRINNITIKIITIKNKILSNNIKIRWITIKIKEISIKY